MVDFEQMPGTAGDKALRLVARVALRVRVSLVLGLQSRVSLVGHSPRLMARPGARGQRACFGPRRALVIPGMITRPFLAVVISVAFAGVLAMPALAQSTAPAQSTTPLRILIRCTLRKSPPPWPTL